LASRRPSRKLEELTEGLLQSALKAKVLLFNNREMQKLLLPAKRGYGHGPTRLFSSYRDLFKEENENK